ncbi:MAG: zinc ribbon domain-containing protein [Phycisphaera sp.]|nr:zinc ribbon domain-containing protein [Phycisphaera sp.]
MILRLHRGMYPCKELAMPVYEYECGKCEKVTETLRKSSDADAPIVCEHCGSDKTRRMHSVFTAAAAAPKRGHCAPQSSGGPCGGCCNPHGSCST